MSLYSKKLHLAKGGTTYNINLYTDYKECSPASDHMMVDGVEVHFSISTNHNDYGATPLRIKETNRNVYCVRTTGVPAYGKNEYRTPGNFTFAVPRGVHKLRVEVAGGGGSSGSGARMIDKGFSPGGKGGNGDKQNTTISVSPTQTISLWVGSGGAAPGNWNKNGNDGGSSGVNDYVSATGGEGGERGEGNGSKKGTNAGNGQGGAGGARANSKSGNAGANGWIIIEWGNGVE